MTADTGCQSVLVGIKIIHRLDFKKSDLIPVKTKMSAVNRDVIPILGAVILRLSGKTGSGKVIETAQICYVTDVIEGAYLSREACTTLGIIPSDFPRIGSATQQPMSVSSAAASLRDEKCDCSCPIRTKPPPLPTALPFPARDANRTALQNWILDRYRSSTFNTCECQTLSLMEGPPLELHVEPEAKPIAVHKPIPVPLHWQQEVKESIDRDVKLGVLEAVPVGEPVTWCHRMVTALKNGKRRRTVDMQVLNKHAVRETHHTQSPFHQATLVPAGTKKTFTDDWNGYHSVPIREEDRHLTTFITPWGRYRYKTKCIDDTCLWAETLQESFFQTCRWLDICGRHVKLFRIPKKLYLAPTRWNLLVSSSLRPISSPVTNISAQFVTFLPHKTSLISDLGLASSTKYRTATPSATTWRLSASISSRQRSIEMISINMFLSNQRLLYWTKSPRVSEYSTPNVSRHRLVQEKHRFLALAEVLHSCPLLNGMENSVRW